MFIRCVGKEKSYKMLSGLCCFVIIYVHLSDNHVKAFNETYIQVKYHISIAVVFLFFICVSFLCMRLPLYSLR